MFGLFTQKSSKCPVDFYLKLSTVREIERLHRRRFKLHQVESSSEKIPAWRVLEWSFLFPIGVIFFLGAKLGE